MNDASEYQKRLPPRLRRAPIWWGRRDVPDDYRPAGYWLIRHGRLPRRDAIPGFLFEPKARLKLAYFRFDDTLEVESIVGDFIVIDLRSGEISDRIPFDPESF